MISFMLAMDRNRVIGLNNDLPWHLPKDFRFFKERTTGHTIVMGRKTYDSLGGALPNRKNVVATRKNMKFPDNVEVIKDLKKIQEWNKADSEEEFFVIGGGEIFQQALPYADRMYITFIDESFEGDSYFPEFNEKEWNLTSKEKGEKDAKNPYDYYFLQYDRK
ncbi:dihydrofolate reductase [Virgibacillus sp. NKC19-3]|uniref:dihydrofolate reductase n=1 Tax=Virgibacillus saliphilus TaxID=2831674 RepID=UPI001C9BA56D|nr:dihydrofolate reductase [Virgibacillus sp. NKC19-3]MBY7143532.1 dihydrofolate reductase [Virgibacillus sp. NKC19-3]